MIPEHVEYFRRLLKHEDGDEDGINELCDSALAWLELSSSGHVVKSVAAVIRQEIDTLLSDYYGDELIAFDGDDAERKELAGARCKAIDWLRRLWSADARASEERLEVVARAVLKHLKERDLK